MSPQAILILMFGVWIVAFGCTVWWIMRQGRRMRDAGFHMAEFYGGDITTDPDAGTVTREGRR